MVRRITIGSALALLLAAPASAHDGHDHLVMGTVTARDAKHIDVKTPSGEVLSIAVNGKTTTIRDKKRSERAHV